MKRAGWDHSSAPACIPSRDGSSPRSKSPTSLQAEKLYFTVNEAALLVASPRTGVQAQVFPPSQGTDTWLPRS